jgi:hypothetical protein
MDFAERFPHVTIALISAALGLFALSAFIGYLHASGYVIPIGPWNF